MKPAYRNAIVKCLATGFGSGLSPVMPGTAGTLVGILVCLVSWPLPWELRLVFVLAIAAGAVYVSGKAEKLFEKKDDQRIVIDEIAGYQLAMLPVAITGLNLCLAFVLFRIFDIWKPFPVNRLQNFKGGWGVVADDLGAGACAALILLLLTLTGGI